MALLDGGDRGVLLEIGFAVGTGIPVIWIGRDQDGDADLVDGHPLIVRLQSLPTPEVLAAAIEAALTLPRPSAPASTATSQV